MFLCFFQFFCYNPHIWVDDLLDESMQEGGVMDTAKISRMLESYISNLRTQIELDIALFEPKEKAEWQEMFRRRAVHLGEVYEQNGMIIASLKEALKEPLTPETAAFLYDELLKTYSNKEFENCVIMPIVELLIPFYESVYDLGRLVRLYNFAYTILVTVSQVTQENAQISRTEYLYNIIAKKEEYAAIEEARSRFEFFMAYYNICVSERADGLVSSNDSYRYLQEMLDFWNSDTVKQLDGDNEQFQWFVSMVQYDWMRIEDSIDEADKEVRERFCSLAERYYEEECKDKEHVYQYNNYVCAAYYHAKVLQGSLSWNDALRTYFSYYKNRLLHSEEEEEASEAGAVVGGLSMDEANFLLDTPPVLERWLRHCTDSGLREEVAERLKADTYAVLVPKFARVSEAWVANELSKWCFALMPYLKSREEKEKWLFNLVVRRQFSTYLHSAMVQKLAEIISEAIIKDCPHLFDEVYALIDGEPLPEFISKCALFHDVGKNEISSIVNMQVRALLDDEFAQIRKHPDYGFALFRNDPDFECYKDVIRGHHRFYNGQGGYPEAFDNTQSPYRIIIDLITICDCLDAATDVLGRNYKRAKSLEDVLEEFEQDKGVRYNPEIVEYIRSKKELQEELRRLITDVRCDMAYEIYHAVTGFFAE